MKSQVNNYKRFRCNLAIGSRWTSTGGTVQTRYFRTWRGAHSTNEELSADQLAPTDVRRYPPPEAVPGLHSQFWPQKVARHTWLASPTRSSSVAGRCVKTRTSNLSPVAKENARSVQLDVRKSCHGHPKTVWVSHRLRAALSHDALGWSALSDPTNYQNAGFRRGR